MVRPRKFPCFAYSLLENLAISDRLTTLTNCGAPTKFAQSVRSTNGRNGEALDGIFMKFRIGEMKQLQFSVRSGTFTGETFVRFCAKY
jgi:hypothetical protein